MSRRPGPAGMPGPGGDMGKMMKQVQQMQSDMAKAQAELADEVVEASAGGGMVEVKMSCGLELREVTIDPEALDPEESELVADMVLAAVNEAMRSAQERAQAKMGGITGGLGDLGLPGV